MEINFTKKPGSEHIISCKRIDGSVTWMKSSSFFVTHDICHYAVETTLRLKKAFYGMLAGGTSINDFELPKEQRTFELTDEALLAEHLVNLLVIEYNQGRVENFADTIRTSYEIKDEVLAELKNGGTDKIRDYFRSLMEKWNGIKVEETLQLEFAE